MGKVTRLAARRRLTPETRRRQLLASALVVFAERGYDGTSLAAVAHRAGVTKPVIYRHFPSKQALHAAVLEAEATALLRTLAARGRTGSTEAQVADLLLAVFEANRAHPYAWRVLVAPRSVAPAVAEAQRAFQAAATAAIAERVLAEPGFAAPPDMPHALAAEALAQAVRSAIDGLLGWWLDHPEVGEREMAAVAMDLLWSGFASGSEGRAWSRVTERAPATPPGRATGPRSLPARPPRTP